MSNKEHLNVEGLVKIIDLSFSMNRASLRDEARKMDLFNLIGHLPIEKLSESDYNKIIIFTLR